MATMVPGLAIANICQEYSCCGCMWCCQVELWRVLHRVESGRGSPAWSIQVQALEWIS